MVELGPGTKALLGSMSLFLLLGKIAPSLTPWMALVPGLTLSSGSRVWTLVTAGLYETSLPMGIVNLAVTGTTGAALERHWGTPSFLLFLGVVNLLTILFAFFGAVFCFFFTQNDKYLFVPLCGFVGCSAGFSVAQWQRDPNKPVLPSMLHNLPFADALHLKHVPLLLVIGSVVLYVMGGVAGKETPLVVGGIFSAWFFLRFHFSDPNTGVVGDLRESFSIASLFPDALGIRAIATMVSVVIYRPCLAMGCLTRSLRSHQALPAHTTAPGLGGSDDPARSAADAAFPFPTSDPTVERRRALAIRAIDEKLAALSAAADAPFPAGPASTTGGDEHEGGLPDIDALDRLVAAEGGNFHDVNLNMQGLENIPGLEGLTIPPELAPNAVTFDKVAVDGRLPDLPLPVSRSAH